MSFDEAKRTMQGALDGYMVAAFLYDTDGNPLHEEIYTGYLTEQEAVDEARNQLDQGMTYCLVSKVISMHESEEQEEVDDRIRCAWCNIAHLWRTANTGNYYCSLECQREYMIADARAAEYSVNH